MPNTRIDDYFRVNKTPLSGRRAKRLVVERSPEIEVAPNAKRPAHKRFAHLIEPVDELGHKDQVKEIPDDDIKQEIRSVSQHEAPLVISKTPVQCRRRVRQTKVTKLKSSETPIAKVKNDSKAPAFERFAYLTEPVSSRSESQPEEPKAVAETIETVAAAEDLCLTQTDLTIPVGLVLPHNLRILLELFRSCDTVVSMLHNRKELCSFDKIQPAVQEIVRRNFQEENVGQFLTVYPMVYFLRYEKQLDKFTRRPTGNYVLVLSPNLRADGTQAGHDSPSKGFLPFSGTRLIQRRNRFHSSLINLVFKAHREFLISELGVDPSQLPEDSALRRWHPKFPLESAVTCIPSAPLPVRPSESQQKITTAKEAVKAFQARALFREADACNQISLNKQQQLSPIPSPKKSAASSPMKTLNASANNSVSTASILAGIKDSSENPSKVLVPSNSAYLKGISQALINKVRARENERRLLTELTYGKVPEARRAVYCRLPMIITQVWSILRSSNSRPVPLSTVAVRVADAHPSGLSADVITEHLNILLELAPCWIEKLNWSTPHLRLKDPGRSVKDVIDLIKSKVAKEGVNI
uniref:CDT1 Geminin-binding domain-containing protein n=1 Tax=Trichobilharzia regenti TaxID=157069 RepID=A0AA85KKM0_TRIRE|nr:unnamed protein product [Trichobilharzia regenti]